MSSARLRTLGRELLAGPFVIWMVLFTIIPLAMMFARGLTDEDGVFTLANIAATGEPIYLNALLLSLELSVVSTVICLLIAYPLALVLRTMKPGSTGAVIFIFVLPMWMNFLLRTIAWMSLLEDQGLINNFLRLLGFEGVQLMYNSGAVLLGMVYNFLPFMVFPIYTSLTKLDPQLGEAAQDLGCNAWNKFVRVTAPLSLPGVISGITMVFMPSVTTFFIPRILGGGNTMMFGDLIESKFLTEGNWNVGSALSLIMMILILLSLSILRKADPEGEGGSLI